MYPWEPEPPPYLWTAHLNPQTLIPTLVSSIALHHSLLVRLLLNCLKHHCISFTTNYNSITSGGFLDAEWPQMLGLTTHPDVPEETTSGSEVLLSIVWRNQWIIRMPVYEGSDNNVIQWTTNRIFSLNPIPAFRNDVQELHQRWKNSKPVNQKSKYSGWSKRERLRVSLP